MCRQLPPRVNESGDYDIDNEIEDVVATINQLGVDIESLEQQYQGLLEEIN